MRSSFLRLAVLIGVCAMTACCPTKASQRPLLGNPENPYPLAAAPKVGEIVHLPTGILVNEEQMISAASDARVVYVGETHDNPGSHRLQLNLLKGLAQRHPGRLAIGMEMFSHSQQPVLDRWVAGELDEKAFVKESHWFDQWKMDFDYYRDLLQYAREHKIPIIALNTEKQAMKSMRGKKTEELTPEERAEMQNFDFNDPYQRAMAKAVFGGHGGEMGQESFLRAQTVWDETMAGTVADYLKSPAGSDKHMLVLAGGHHISYGFGIPRRVFRRLPASYVTIGGDEIQIVSAKADRFMNVTFPQFPMVPYDFLAYLAYEELPKQAVKLGIEIEPSADGRGLTVKNVVAGSNAEKAGVQQGDLLLSFDGEPVKEPFDLIYSVKRKHAGDHGKLQLERKGEKLNLDVPLKP